MELSLTNAVRHYTDNRSATAATEDGQGPAARFGDAASAFAETLRASERTAMDAMSGGADPHALVQALA